MSLSALYILRRRNKRRREVAKFRELIAVPALGAVTLPANARLRFQSAAGSPAGALAGTIQGPTLREVHVPLLVPGDYGGIVYAEADSVVTLEPGFSLLLETGLGRLATVATA